MHLRSAAAAILIALASSASADVVLQPKYEYDDFFKSCRGSIYFEGDVAAITGSFTFEAQDYRWACGLDRVASGGGGHRCEGETSVKYECADITDYTIHALRCFDDAGAEKGCGSVSVDQISAPKISVADGAAVEGSRLIAVASGFDDFFERCEIDFVVNTPYPDGKVTFDYIVSAAGESEAMTCEHTVFANGGGGGSCSGVFGHKYSCAEIDSVVTTVPQCLDENEAPRSCGAVSAVSVGVNGFAIGD